MLLSRPLVLFAGKGGVGKTTLATACALHASDGGTRTLLVSTDPAHSTADLLGQSIGPEPTSIERNLEAVELDPDREAARYVAAAADRMVAITPPGMQPEIDRQLALARATPGVVEAAVLERLATLAADRRWERVLVDTAPFGHTLRLLASPETLGRWLDTVIGRRRALGALERMWREVRGNAPDTDPVLEALERRRTLIASLHARLTDRARCAVVLVTVPEHLSVRETERSAATLRDAGITPTLLAVNRMRPEREEGLAALAGLFPDLPRVVIDEQPTDVRDRDALRYIGARLEVTA